MRRPAVPPLEAALLTEVVGLSAVLVMHTQGSVLIWTTFAQNLRRLSVQSA